MEHKHKNFYKVPECRYFWKLITVGSGSLCDLGIHVARANVLETARRSLLDFCRPFKFVVVSRPQDWL